MFGHVNIDPEVIDSAIADLEEFYKQKYGTQPESLVHAIALEKLAARVYERIAAHQVAKSGVECQKS